MSKSISQAILVKKRLKRFLKSLKRKGKIKGHINSVQAPHLSKNLEHLISKSNVFSNKDYSKSSQNKFRIPKIFSLIDSPDDSFAFLKNLLFSLSNQDAFEVVIDYSNCERIDLDASICMDIILKDFITYFNKRSHFGIKNSIKKINTTGESPQIKNFLYSIGAYKNIANRQNKNDESLICYPLCIGYRATKKNDNRNKSNKERDVTNLVDYVNNCLKKLNKSELTAKSKKYIADISGEIITNAEDHSSTNYRYSIGYFEEKVDENLNHYGVFNLVILNFGMSIYERLTNPYECKNSDIIIKMKELSSKYTKESLFSFNEFTEESLWTLYALQDGVSSISPHRGNGTIKFMDCFLKLKGEDYKNDDFSKLSLISGNTLITFDGKYDFKTKIVDGEEFKIMAFNEKGDLDFKPDNNYVRSIPNYFPGTIIIAKVLIKDENIKINS